MQQQCHRNHSGYGSAKGRRSYIVTSVSRWLNPCPEWTLCRYKSGGRSSLSIRQSAVQYNQHGSRFVLIGFTHTFYSLCTSKEAYRNMGCNWYKVINTVSSRGRLPNTVCWCVIACQRCVLPCNIWHINVTVCNLVCTQLPFMYITSDSFNIGFTIWIAITWYSGLESYAVHREQGSFWVWC